MDFDFASNENLLGIEEICRKLSISRTTFERLRNPQRRSGLEMVHGLGGDHSDDYSGMPPFPDPTITLGRSPRWSVITLNKWIASRPIVGQDLGILRRAR